MKGGRHMRRGLAASVAGIVMLTGLVVGQATPTGAIIGGSVASESDYPYFAKVWVDQTYNIVCGGTVIDWQYVLTAAHCVDGDAIDRGVGVTLRGSQAYEAKDVVIHPMWGDYDHAYDLALLRLEPAAVSGGGVFAPITPVTVGSPTDTSLYQPERYATVLGRGASNTDGTNTGTFKRLNTGLRNDDYMDDLYNHWLGNDWWYARLMIGAGSGGATACYGDSGGPLVVWKNRNVPVQVGVASFTNEPFWVFNGDTCDRAGAYAELSGSMLAWIGHYADVRFGWERCMDENGDIGVYIARWGEGYAGVRPNHDNQDWWWGFTCHVEWQRPPIKGGGMSRPPQDGIYETPPPRHTPGGPNTDEGVDDSSRTWGPRSGPDLETRGEVTEPEPS
jgi:hypothetical protein